MKNVRSKFAIIRKCVLPSGVLHVLGSEVVAAMCVTNRFEQLSISSVVCWYGDKAYSRETHPWFPPTHEADLQKEYVAVIAAVPASVAAQAAGGSKQNEEGSIERTVNSMFKMNLKKGRV